ncbi:MAG: UDP-N-acetylmuramoyl-L-alanyl-D-glutamate--2,6-diaminopimelate ligase [Aggregatilineales bacterium]|nr:UDP-N-acetylmuramoyl-L-alanyl-D-glutamate--2,6-diaminopimelate ligase [Chloroflexota bacterium]HOA22766.1 UDP-N-acetylmuramoyl-L-alanyl-D-glutamate--2,6-diaminopimelate ligase [Aggregatilineales bacterium]HPV07847.1 UDP-N-acetylmuramoyl-L-alanyl-D-glutamate--2,6-diaminopimelate ligase [Aggregatilineales bacterium]
MKLSDLLKHVPGILARPEADPDIIAPIVEDSRAVEPGGIFVARVGGSADGHRFIPDAVARGVAAVVGERPPAEISAPVPYVQVEDAALALAVLAAARAGFPSRRLTMIGVTGTDGKTTTSMLIHSIMRAAGLAAGMITTISAELGDESLDTGLHVTTPTAPEVQGYLARMVEAGLTHCVLEATSHGLAQHRVSAVDFDVAVVTNIQHEHLDFHGSWEAYRDAKARLFHHVATSTRKPGVPKLAVINLDDKPSAGVLLDIPADRHLTYSLDPASGATVRAGEVVYGPDSTRVTIHLPDDGMVNVSSALIGEYNVSNILAAITAAYGLGLPVEAIRQGVEAVKAIPGRMERIDEGQDFIAVVDFAHTPNALRRALEAARLMIPPEGRVIVAFGSAGLRDPEKRAMMGRIAAELADFTVLTAEDPRTESLDDILAASAEAAREAGGVEGETFWRVPDRGEALHFAVKLARPGDIVLACGKGHEQSMCFGTTEYPWDDREALRAALRGQPLRTLPTARGL